MGFGGGLSNLAILVRASEGMLTPHCSRTSGARSAEFGGRVVSLQVLAPSGAWTMPIVVAPSGLRTV